MSSVELSPRERDRLVEVLRDLTGNAERRRDRRRDVSVNLYVRKVKSARPANGHSDDIGLYQAQIINVASRGVGFKVKTHFETGDKIVLPLRFREGGGWLVLCQVRSCTLLSDGQFRVGAKFIERLDDPEGIAKVPVDWLL